MAILRRLLFAAGCFDVDDGVFAFVVLLRVLLAVAVAPPRLTGGVRRRFGEVVVDLVFAALLAFFLGDFLPVENGAVVADAAGTGDGDAVVVFVADPNCCCCCRRLSRHALARARASAASFLDFFLADGVAPPPSSSLVATTASAFRFLGGIVVKAAWLSTQRCSIAIGHHQRLQRLWEDSQ